MTLIYSANGDLLFLHSCKKCISRYFRQSTIYALNGITSDKQAKCVDLNLLFILKVYSVSGCRGTSVSGAIYALSISSMMSLLAKLSNKPDTFYFDPDTL